MQKRWRNYPLWRYHVKLSHKKSVFRQAIQLMESDEEEDCEEFPVEINKQAKWSLPVKPIFRFNFSGSVLYLKSFTRVYRRLPVLGTGSPWFLSDAWTQTAEYIECQAFFPVVRIGSPHPLPRKQSSPRDRHWGILCTTNYLRVEPIVLTQQGVS